MITSDLARTFFSYDPLTGEVRWKLSKGRAKAGELAATSTHDGYLRVKFEGRHYRLHRLIFLIMTGRWPEPDCDHKNMNRTDNRWDNLREASRSQNQANHKMHPKNVSGYKGVSWHSATNRWRATIKKDGKLISLGYYHDPEKAHLAYIEKAKELFGEFARLK